MSEISVAPLKVCFITGTFPPMRCGIGDYTERLVKALASSENQLDLAIEVLTSAEATTAGATPPNLKILNLVSRWDWDVLPRLLQHLKRSRPAIVHFQYPTAAYGRQPMITLLPWLVWLVGLFTPGWSPKRFVTIHEFASFRLLGKIRIWLMILGCQTIIGVSLETVAALRPLKLLGKQLKHIPIGSNITTEPPAAYRQNSLEWLHQKGVATDRPVIAYFGFISPSKGLPDLLQAFSQLADSAQLLLIAEPQAQDPAYQSYFDQLAELIKSLGLQTKIKWTGFADESEVTAYLQSATIAVFPFTDGVSLRRTSLLAAMLNGTPVLSTFSTYALDEGLQTGENIWLAAAHNPASLQRAMQTLLNDSLLRRHLAENGLKLTAQFNWSLISQQHLKLYFK